MASALAEEPAEVLVVEDGTAGVDEARLGGARLLRLPHVRRSRARNAGVEASTTTFVAFLDEDDLCLPGRLERQRECLLAAPAATMSYARVIVIDGTGAPIPSWNDLLAKRFDKLVRRGTTFEAVVALGGPLYTSATMVRRDDFLATGGFDQAFDAHEDLDLYLRLARNGKLVPCLGPAVTSYRLHGANTSSDALYRGTLGVTAKHLPDARGGDRRVLIERRIDALWGLGEFAGVRHEAFAAAVAHPLLLSHPRFMKRVVASLMPTPILERRR